MSEHCLSFTVLGEPVGKARPRVARFGTYTPEVTVLYENLVKMEYRRQCGDKTFRNDMPLLLEVDAFYMIPISTSKKKRAMMLDSEIRPMKKPDWDNIGKIISDALNKIAYRDDAQIVECRITKHYAVNPRVMVRLTDVSRTKGEQPWK